VPATTKNRRVVAGSLGDQPGRNNSCDYANIGIIAKNAFVEGYHKQIQEYDQARSCIFDDWKRWIDSGQIAKKLELNDIYCADGFKAVEKELADILDGYVGAGKGKQDAERWIAFLTCRRLCKVSLATGTLMLEFAAPAAAMGA
tara:strand:- start:4269 stop:4700 length:432 start_codon:yes stop_codon:yes gene_type:complete